MEITLSPLLAASGPAADFLCVETGSLAGQRFVLPQAPGAILLGRERMCNVRFDPDKDRVVGRAHARIEVRPDGIYLIDLNSANGTFRADGRAVRGEVRLEAGDRFQLGGEGGPWLSLHKGTTNTAVHVAPPASEMPTLVTPALAPQGVSVKPWGMPNGASVARGATHELPPSGTPQRPVVPAETIAPRIVTPEPAPMRRPEIGAVTPPAPVDPLVLQHRKQYQRQIAVIALLLVLAGAVGLALGLREPAGESPDEVAHGE